MTLAEEFEKRMREIAAGDDPEEDHGSADDLLIELLTRIGGFENVIAAYRSVHKWYA